MSSDSRSARDDELDRLVFAYLVKRDEGFAHDSAVFEALNGRLHREADLRRSLGALIATGLVTFYGAPGDGNLGRHQEGSGG